MPYHLGVQTNGLLLAVQFRGIAVEALAFGAWLFCLLQCRVQVLNSRSIIVGWLIFHRGCCSNQATY